MTRTLPLFTGMRFGARTPIRPTTMVPLLSAKITAQQSHSHSLVRKTLASLSFQLIQLSSGVAVYYLHALFTKSALSADISIDSGVSHRVNLTKPIGAPKDFAQPLWATIDPTNEMHVVDISLPDGGQYIVVDGFM